MAEAFERLKKKRERPKGGVGEANVATSKKVAVWGPIGSGKTSVLLGPLVAGDRLLGLSTDFGGNGLLSVIEWCKAHDREDLLQNIWNVDLTEYNDIEHFLKGNVQDFFEGDVESYQPTVCFWDGFTGAQLGAVDRHILSFAGGKTKDDDATGLREAGLALGIRDYSALLHITMWCLERFLALRIGNTTQHKILTCLEDKPKDDDYARAKAKIGPLLFGAARTMMGGGFDVVLQTEVKRDGNDLKYDYIFRDPRKEVKFRSGGKQSKLWKKINTQFEDREEADPIKLWNILTKTTLEG